MSIEKLVTSKQDIGFGRFTIVLYECLQGRGLTSSKVEV